MLSWFDIELTVIETVLVGGILVACLLIWAFLPARDTETEPTNSRQ